MANRALIERLRNQISAIESAGSVAPFDNSGETTSVDSPPRGYKRRNNEDDCEGIQDAEHAQYDNDSDVEPLESVQQDGDDALHHSNDKKDALKKIVALVNVSERSEHAVRERLARDGYTAEEIEHAVARALEYGFIDDMRFASILIRSRLVQGKGSAGIRRELAGHGIELDDVPGWPYDFEVDEEDEESRAFAYLQSHPTRSKNKRDGAYRKLVQRGFSSSVAARVARQWAEQ